MGMLKVMEKSSNPTWILMALALPILYFFSIGPVVFLAEKTDMYPDLLLKVYSPVVWLHDHTVLKKPLEDYVNFWDHLAG